MTSAFFTGHRIISKTNLDIIKPQLCTTLMHLTEQGILDFYAGGALGWDMLCEETILMMKSKTPQIKLNLLLPCPPEVQTAKWKSDDIRKYNDILSKADDIEIVSPEYTSKCMYKRNRALVEKGGYCLCYYNSKKYASGTGQTVRMAENKQLPIYNFFIP